MQRAGERQDAVSIGDVAFLCISTVLFVLKDYFYIVGAPIVRFPKSSSIQRYEVDLEICLNMRPVIALSLDEDSLVLYYDYL